MVMSVTRFSGVRANTGIGVCLPALMAGFQEENWAALMPFCDSTAEQVSPDTTRWNLLQLEARPDWVGWLAAEVVVFVLVAKVVGGFVTVVRVMLAVLLVLVVTVITVVGVELGASVVTVPITQ